MVNLRMRQKNSQRVLQHGLAVDFHILFGLARTEARAHAGGGNQRNMAAHALSPPACARQAQGPPPALSSASR